MPLDEAPTTNTPPSATWAGLRYDWAVSAATDGGTLAAKAGIRAMLQAPEAMTTVRQCQSPRSVRTRYPAPSLRTEVTVVWVRTGAAIDFA